MHMWKNGDNFTPDYTMTSRELIKCIKIWSQSNFLCYILCISDSHFSSAHLNKCLISRYWDRKKEAQAFAYSKRKKKERKNI